MEYILHAWGNMFGPFLPNKTTFGLYGSIQCILEGKIGGATPPKSDASWYRVKICEVKENLKAFYSSILYIKEDYGKLIGDHVRVPWAKVVWNRLSTP